MVVISDISTVGVLAAQLLGVAEDALALTTEGTPSRSYISPAAPTFDCCPFLSVHVAALSEESTSPVSPSAAPGRRTSYGRLNLVTYVMTAVRCAAEIPPEGVPSVADLEAVASQVQQDGWALWNALRWAVEDGVFLDECSIVHWDSSTFVREQGGCVGWEFTIRAEIGGIPNPPGS